MVKLTRRQALVSGAALALTACVPERAVAPDATSTSGSVSTSTPAPKRGGLLRVSGLITSDATYTYDPYGVFHNSMTVTKSLMFEGLTEILPDATVAPALAESWRISPDGKVYTFKLRGGVKFHNGREVTAQDVRYSFDRIKDPATKHPNRALYDVISGVEATDASTVVMTLKAPYAPLLAILGDVASSIVPKEEVDKGTFGRNPVGTGPFKFAGEVVSQSVSLDAHKEYWRQGLPKLDGIRLTVIDDLQSRVAALRSGQVDLLYQAPDENYPQFKQDPTFVVHGGSGQQNFGWFLLNPEKVPAFKDPRVRQAIFAIIDRDAVSDIALPGLSQSLKAGFLPAGHWAALKSSVYEKPDAAKARQLLSDAGVASGLKFKIFANPFNGFHRSAQIIQQQLRTVGIETEVVISPPGTTTLLGKGDFESYVHGSPSTLDPDQQFFAMFMPGGGRNYTKFEDQQMSDLVRKAQASTDQAERARLYQDAQRRVAESGHMAFLYNYSKYDLSYTYVKDYVYNAPVNQWHLVRNVWLDK